MIGRDESRRKRGHVFGRRDQAARFLHLVWVQALGSAALSVSDPLSSILLFAACVVGGLGVALALPRRGLNPQIIGALVAALGLGIMYLWLGRRLQEGEGLPNPNFYLFGLIALGSALRVISHPRPVYSALWFIMTVLASSGLFVLLSAEFMAFALIIVYAGAILITYLFVIMLATESPTADQVESLSEYDRYSREPFMATVFGFALIAALTPMLARGSAELKVPVKYATAERIELMPGKVESALKDVGVLLPDERIISATPNGAVKPIEVDEATGLVTAVTVRYGQGQTKRVTAEHANWPQDLRLSNVEGVGFTLLADHPGAIEVAGVVLLMAMVGAVLLARKKVELDEREKLTAQSRMLGAEFKPEKSPLMAPDTPGSPTVREASLGASELTGIGGRA